MKTDWGAVWGTAWGNTIKHLLHLLYISSSASGLKCYIAHHALTQHSSKIVNLPKEIQFFKIKYWNVIILPDLWPIFVCVWVGVCVWGLQEIVLLCASSVVNITWHQFFAAKCVDIFSDLTTYTKYQSWC